MMERVAKISPLQWYIMGGLLSFVARFAKNYSETAWIGILCVALAFCITGIVKYFRS